MHIPDNFLSTPVWASLDAVAVPAVAVMIRRAGRELEDGCVPLMGVMGAFVFAAQMINFPVGIGTSGHLLGGALLACTLGLAPAALVMTTIIVLQALVFQDGGVLALGANVFNMAIVGVLAGYLPWKLWGAGKRRKVAIFGGAFFSVLCSALLALSELLISGIRMPRTVLVISIGLFTVSALIEGAITLSVVQALAKLNPRFVQNPAAPSGRAIAAVSGGALIVATAGIFLASSAPDGIMRLGADLGLRTQTILHAPLADYTLASFQSPWLRKATAGLAGLLLIYAICTGAGKWITRHRSA
jgi:cobalt/nickel transport system permease protein